MYVYTTFKPNVLTHTALAAWYNACKLTEITAVQSALVPVLVSSNCTFRSCVVFGRFKFGN